MELPGGVWVDPCAGSGNLIQSVSMLRRDIEWRTFEVREECKDGLQAIDASPTICDFLDGSVTPSPCDVVFMNPPYRLSQPFIEKSLTFARNAVVALLRLNYLGSRKRHELMQLNCPDVYVLPNRPSFAATGQTDSIEYAWMVFRPDLPRKVGSIRVLALTPKEERRL